MMNEIQSFQQSYKSKLNHLLHLWADSRNAKTMEKFEEFKTAVNHLEVEAFSVNLNAVRLLLSDIIDSVNSALQSKTKVIDSISAIDTSMNQLIASSKLSPDPLIQDGIKTHNQTSEQKPEYVHTFRTERNEMPLRVAVVDDEESIAQCTAKLLESYQFEVTVYADIISLNKDLALSKPHVVLLDIIMPNVSQKQVFEFAKKLKYRGIKCICLSSLFTLETRLDAVRSGCADFAVKPVNMTQLVTKIRKVMEVGLPNQYKLILLDDDSSMINYYTSLFEQQNLIVDSFQSTEELFNSIETIMPDMFLIDLNMPHVNGFEVTKMLRQQSKFDHTPIVILTGEDDEETKLAALDAGANDLITKSTSPMVLHRQVSSRLKSSFQSRLLISKDPLTGVLNHGRIMEAANLSFRLGKRNKQPMIVVMIDVDYFKKVNDTYGHAAGDKVLIGLGQLMNGSVRESDQVGRYGGEEFLLLFNNADVVKIEEKVNAMKEAFAQLSFQSGDEKFSCSFSAGVSLANDFTSIKDAIEHADLALYASKNEGRNKVSVYVNTESLE